MTDATPPDSDPAETRPPEGILKGARAPYWVRRFRESLSTPGILVGTLFFALSLTPSLLPRSWVVQAVLSGLCMAAGYALGVLYRWLWEYFELPLPERHVQQWILWVAGGFCAVVALGFLWHASEWQNSVRVLMELEPVDTARPIRVGILAFLLFTVLLGLGRLFHLTHRLISSKIGQGVPRRVASVLSLIIAVTIFWAVIDGVVFQQALRTADRTFERLDAREGADTAEPTDPFRTGSARSLIAWGDLGRTGRNFVSATPTDEELRDFLGEEIVRPIRVYVGLNAAETPQARARLALDELERVGAFDRAVLVIVIPTGTGWVDPAAITTLEHLHRGDVASVAVQYSYLPSWLTLLSDPQYGAETADALFEAVYGRWTGLPPDDRPELYLHGVSLGALNSQQSADLYDVIADPFAGALWVGAPFRSETWRDITRQRASDSPAWLPRFRDGSVIRFMNQDGFSHPPEAPWGPLRIIYLQYASDPITFFEPEVFYRSPEWLEDPRGPDVSDRVRWYPIVTMLQLLADLAVGDTAPVGYGHVYAAEDYIDAWIEVTDPTGWTDDEVQRLKEHLRTPRTGGLHGNSTDVDRASDPDHEDTIDDV
jgi:uncharacterized membrane protein